MSTGYFSPGFFKSLCGITKLVWCLAFFGCTVIKSTLLIFYSPPQYQRHDLKHFTVLRIECPLSLSFPLPVLWDTGKVSIVLTFDYAYFLWRYCMGDKLAALKTKLLLG